MCKQAGFTKVVPLVYTLINETFQEPNYSYKLANMIKEWLVLKELIENEVLENWMLDMEKISAKEDFFFSINRNLCVCVK